MKTTDLSKQRSARALNRPAIALAVSAVLGAMTFVLPAHAAGHGGTTQPCEQMSHGQHMQHGQQMQHAHGQREGDGKSHAQGGQAHRADARQHQGGHHGGHQGRHARGGERGGGMFLTERMLDRVQATDEQKTRIREIMMAARKDLQARRDEDKALRDQGAKLFSQAEIDPKAIESLRAQAMARRDAASKRMTQAMVEASQVLTPAQRQQLAQYAEHRRDMMRRHHEERRTLEAPRS